MILSASRRTDIPAFYGDWLLRRLQAGEIYSKNPFNPKMISRIPLSLQTVDCIIFWTKNPAPFLNMLPKIDNLGYHYYFTFTLTPYDKDLEPGLPPKTEVLETFKNLSRKIGKQKVVWRYDPILFTGKYNFDFHVQAFRALCEKLSPFTERCIISFLSAYKKIQGAMENHQILMPALKEKHKLLKELGKISHESDIPLYTCFQDLDLSAYPNINKGACIDQKLIEQIIGCRIKAKTDPSQRPDCLCIQSRDIGSYNCCTHNCIYCYAGGSRQNQQKNLAAYKPESPLLCSSLQGTEIIKTIPDAKSWKITSAQNDLFD